MHTPDFSASWLSLSKPRMGYRVLPKCGCTSIGQIFHHVETGGFCAGNIHSSDSAMYRWDALESRAHMISIIMNEPVYWFTLVRNPYRRLLSAFADKIFGFQEDGRRYYEGEFHRHLHACGLHWGPKSNLIDNFRIFVRFAAASIETGKPIGADVHWIPCFKQLAYTARRNPDWKLDFIGHIESFRKDMDDVIHSSGVDLARVPDNIPRENTTSLPDISIAMFYGEEEVEIMKRVFAQDFKVFGYSTDPEQVKPVRPISANEVNTAIREASRVK